MLCDETFPGEMPFTCLLTPDREPPKYQSMDTAKVQFGKPMDFTGVTYRSMGKALLTGRNESKIATSPKKAHCSVHGSALSWDILQPEGSSTG